MILAKTVALTPFLLFSLWAQPPLCLNAGGPDILDSDGVTIKCHSDAAYVSGGIAYSDPLMGLAELGTLRYGTFSYSIPRIPGFYSISLDFVEPTKSAAGQRLFTVSVNGSQTENLDIYSLAGGSGGLYASHSVKLFAVSNGLINIQFKTILWNAFVNRIVIDKILPQDIFQPYVTLLSFPFASVTRITASTQVNSFQFPAGSVVCFAARGSNSLVRDMDYVIVGNAIVFTHPPIIGEIIQLLCF